jgi:hypothetical protein
MITKKWEICVFGLKLHAVSQWKWCDEIGVMQSPVKGFFNMEFLGGTS